MGALAVRFHLLGALKNPPRHWSLSSMQEKTGDRSQGDCGLRIASAPETDALLAAVNVIEDPATRATVWAAKAEAIVETYALPDK